MDSQYDKLLKAVAVFPSVLETISKDRDAMSQFIGYLTQNDAEISKFGNASLELYDYMAKYTFTKNYNFDTMRIKLEALHPLRLKLVKMGEEAKKLIAFPDRYNSKKAIEICRGLAMTCLERLKFDEIDKVEKLVETNTKRLIEIQKLFKRDEAILALINEAITTDKAVLNKFKACYDELKQYIAEFPHQYGNDLTTVQGRIAVLKQIDFLSDTTSKAIDGIRKYADRFNKIALVNSYSQLVIDLSSKMRFADVPNYSNRLDGIIKQVKLLKNSFDKECQDLQAFKAILMQHTPDLWKDDNERQLLKVNSILTNDPKTVSFDLKQLKMDYDNAKHKRFSDIDATLKKYKWLGYSRRYKPSHDALKTKYITFAEYQAAVEMIRKERVKFLLCIPIIGWIILIVTK